MRIRSFKPEFWRSRDIIDIGDWGDRLLFLGLWSYVDDNGVGRDEEQLIMADLFALENDPRDTLAKVSGGLQKLFSLGRITRFTVDGRPFLHITNWDKHQRIDKPAKPRYPLPTCENAVIRGTLATVSRHSPEILAPGTVEQGNRGTGEQSSSSATADASPDPDDVPPLEHRDDVEQVCLHLINRMVANGCSRPAVTNRWRDAARLMIDKEGRTVEQIVAAINWCQSDTFWKANILSLPKLRQKYDQLRLAAERERIPSSRQQETDDLFDAAWQRANATQVPYDVREIG